VNISPAALVRSLGDDPPTLLLDEADTVFGKKAADLHEDLRGLLNAGHQRNRPYIRWDATARPAEHCPTFAMAALAGIGDMPEAIEDRSVIIAMRRRARGETVQPFRQRRDAPCMSTGPRLPVILLVETASAMAAGRYRRAGAPARPMWPTCWCRCTGCRSPPGKVAAYLNGPPPPPAARPLLAPRRMAGPVGRLAHQQPGRCSLDFRRQSGPRRSSRRSGVRPVPRAAPAPRCGPTAAA
jgi:hypothetical protein